MNYFFAKMVYDTIEDPFKFTEDIVKFREIHAIKKMAELFQIDKDISTIVMDKIKEGYSLKYSLALGFFAYSAPFMEKDILDAIGIESNDQAVLVTMETLSKFVEFCNSKTLIADDFLDRVHESYAAESNISMFNQETAICVAFLCTGGRIGLDAEVSIKPAPLGFFPHTLGETPKEVCLVEQEVNGEHLFMYMDMQFLRVYTNVPFDAILYTDLSEFYSIPETNEPIGFFTITPSFIEGFFKDFNLNNGSPIYQRSNTHYFIFENSEHSVRFSKTDILDFSAYYLSNGEENPMNLNFGSVYRYFVKKGLVGMDIKAVKYITAYGTEKLFEDHKNLLGLCVAGIFALSSDESLEREITKIQKRTDWSIRNEDSEYFVRFCTDKNEYFVRVKKSDPFNVKAFKDEEHSVSLSLDHRAIFYFLRNKGYIFPNLPILQ